MTATYRIVFPFPKQGEPQAAGDLTEVAESQATWWRPDGRIAPAQRTGAVRGTVWMQLGGDEPVPYGLGLSVQITDATGEVHRVPVSATDGTYVAPEVAAGGAQIEPDPSTLPISGASGEWPVSLTVVAGQEQHAPELVIRLEPES